MTAEPRSHKPRYHPPDICLIHLPCAALCSGRSRRLVPHTLAQLVVSEQSNPAGRKLQWLAHDQLGTPRMIFDTSGKLHDDPATTNVVEGVRRHDYLPFGEENVYNAAGGSRTAANGYLLNDGVRQQFGSKERDTETGLDYFGFRYYSSTQGRFTSPDEPLIDQWEHDPQSWNLYTYVTNNPLKYTDPLGLWKEIAGGVWEWEKGDTWESLAKKLKVNVNTLTNAFPNTTLGAGVALYMNWLQVLISR